MSKAYTKKIVCFGDSNTYGYNAKMINRFTEDERWTCLMAKYLGEGYHVAEEGLEGRTACLEDPLFEGLCGFQYLYPCLMTHKPVDLLVIMLGTNDVKQRFSCTPENVAKGMERLVQKAVDSKLAFRDGKPNILLITPPAIEPGYRGTSIYGEMGEGCVEKSRALAPLYEQVAKNMGCHYLNAGQIPGVEMNPYDFMHLSLEAHRVFAKFLAEKIPELVQA
ncbi:MAG: lipolytic enzyme, G-D-S-L [Lachnospiraceae bacterium]|nr:lipolytic enzyme, G-D-S-L [Lachnospiraceae bacterium]MDE6184711.1 lipolytic enzyme, G-D-S-L [Lachnospiraceae bacterium]